MSDAPRIQVILASTRPGRFGEKAAAWAIDRLGTREDLEAELVDLRDYPMPFYEQDRPPTVTANTHPRSSPGRRSWTRPTGTSSSPPSTTTATRQC